MSFRTKARLDQLIANISKDFSLETLSKSPSRFNLQKLDWFNKEYLKTISLEDFCLRASLLKAKNSPGLDYKQKDMKYRIGDYAFLVDVKKQKVMVFDSGTETISFGGKHYLIGGGRKKDENPIENLQREVLEESLGKVSLDVAKIKELITFKIDAPFDYPGEGSYDGKEINIYFYPLSKEALPPYLLEDIGSYQSSWIPLVEFLRDNTYLNYPIWKDFCLNNNLDLIDPDENIKTQYLAWLLDKNRTTILSEIGTESSCILEYQKPPEEDLKWKKISLLESRSNLAEIAEFVIKIMKTDEFESLQNNLYEVIFKEDIEKIFQNLVSKWEEVIKAWLTENQKSVGDYLWPLRVCLSGKIKSPSPFELLSVLRVSEVERRLGLFL